jgi:hypothetical protein
LPADASVRTRRRGRSLRAPKIGLDSDIGCGFIVDCCRFCEGLITEVQIKTTHRHRRKRAIIVQAVQREKERRIANGAAAREKAQHLFLATPDVLNGIIHDANLSPRHRVDACRELRAVATSGSESTPATGDQFIIRIDLTAGGGEVVEFNKALAIEPRHNENEKGVSDESIR